MSLRARSIRRSCCPLFTLCLQPRRRRSNIRTGRYARAGAALEKFRTMQTARSIAKDAPSEHTETP